jgi:hypothetical protein
MALKGQVYLGQHPALIDAIPPGIYRVRDGGRDGGRDRRAGTLEPDPKTVAQCRFVCFAVPDLTATASSDVDRGASQTSLIERGWIERDAIGAVTERRVEDQRRVIGDTLLSRGTESLLTLRWRKADSNSWSRFEKTLPRRATRFRVLRPARAAPLARGSKVRTRFLPSGVAIFYVGPEAAKRARAAPAMKDASFGAASSRLRRCARRRTSCSGLWSSAWQRWASAGRM